MKMKFNGGITKAITMSYDDGVYQDIQLIWIMKKYGLKGTFNIYAGMFFPKDDIREEKRTFQAVRSNCTILAIWDWSGNSLFDASFFRKDWFCWSYLWSNRGSTQVGGCFLHTTNIEIYNYVKAYESLETSYEKKVIHNPSSIDVWVEINKKLYEIKAGETVKIWENQEF